MAFTKKWWPGGRWRWRWCCVHYQSKAMGGEEQKDKDYYREKCGRRDVFRNGFMHHIMGHKLSHIYAREVRWNFEFDSWYLSKICSCLSKKNWHSLHLLFFIMSTLKGDVRVKMFHFPFFFFSTVCKKRWILYRMCLGECNILMLAFLLFFLS